MVYNCIKFGFHHSIVYYLENEENFPKTHVINEKEDLLRFHSQKVNEYMGKLIENE